MLIGLTHAQNWCGEGFLALGKKPAGIFPHFLSTFVHQILRMTKFVVYTPGRHGNIVIIRVLDYILCPRKSSNLVYSMRSMNFGIDLWTRYWKYLNSFFYISFSKLSNIISYQHFHVETRDYEYIPWYKPDVSIARRSRRRSHLAYDVVHFVRLAQVSDHI